MVEQPTEPTSSRILITPDYFFCAQRSSPGAGVGFAWKYVSVAIPWSGEGCLEKIPPCSDMVYHHLRVKYAENRQKSRPATGFPPLRTRNLTHPVIAQMHG